MPDTSSVVIVGGGAAGCATAYFLAKAGIRATVIEREGVGSMASGFSSGGINPLEGAGIPGPLSELAMASFRLHQSIAPELVDESGVDYGLETISMLTLAFDDDAIPTLTETHRIFDSAGDGFWARWLDSGQATEIEPRIGPGAIRALETHGNAMLSSYRYTLALAQAAENMGAVVRSGNVTGVESSGGRVSSVTLESGPIECDAVVFATGPWSGQVAEWLGVPVPVEPLKGENLRMILPGQPQPTHDIVGGGVSIFHREEGQVWVGSSEERAGFDNEPSIAARDRLMALALRLMPAMADAELVLHTACLRPVTSDWLPIIGRAPGWDNAYLATGAGKKGILISTGMGKAVADVIASGSTDVPTGGLEPDRFEG
ncbi:MAG: FAD-dependent oxidoreductase [SAR202 cluster bacterium]|nr:FAD-dependent oxidoreductase [SAR202 cluster bacterium]|tara:strand:+ start:632 stop:1753 length:1122 start_codon:yes stop_codon:yes gene_type:complete